MKVDRVFMPIIVVMPSENPEPTSFSRCALVKGYPIVIKNSDNPYKEFGVPFDSPYFYWYSNDDRRRQLCDYMEKEFGIDRKLTERAVDFAEAAQTQFDTELKAKGQEATFEEVLKNVQERDYIDSHREMNPLRKAEDAIELDNSHMTIDEQMIWFDGVLKGRFGDAVYASEG